MYYLSFVSYFSTSGESMHHLVEITGNEDKAFGKFGKCRRYFNQKYFEIIARVISLL